MRLDAVAAKKKLLPAVFNPEFESLVSGTGLIAPHLHHIIAAGFWLQRHS